MANARDELQNDMKLHSKRCSNPMDRPGHVGSNLRTISKAILERFPNLHPQSKICHTCRKSLYNKEGEDISFESNITENSMDLDEISSEPPSKKLCRSRAEQLEDVFDGLKEKFNSLPDTDPMKQTILTVCPEYWSIRQISEEFLCSYRMAKQSKELKKSGGVLAVPPFKKGKNLDENVVSKVIEFYQNDDNSRVMPNKKDTVTVKIDGCKEIKQKRLLLYDIKVLHSMFKERYPQLQIGKSKFAELRPKWCITAGASGTHSVCVCTTHQNVKTMIDAINLKMLTKNSEIQLNDYKDCISVILCKDPKSACYLNQCMNCPGVKEFSDLIEGLLEVKNVHQVIYSTWESADRCTLKQQCLSTEDFVDELCTRFESLIPHHFISKAQTEFISEMKEHLREDEVLLQCDFAENYAYVVQNAAQAFHYNNDQCTVFTVVFYYRSKKELKHRNIILLSDCTTHDAAAVYLMQQRVTLEIKKLSPKVKKIYYVTDGAKQHFKNRTQMRYLMNHKLDFDIDAEWHCHATSHGKCACDGLGACLKSEATRYSLQVDPNNAILNSRSLFTWATSKFQNIKFFHYTKEDHESILKILKKKFPQPLAVSNIQKSHAFVPTSGDVLQIKRYSAAKEDIIHQQY